MVLFLWQMLLIPFFWHQRMNMEEIAFVCTVTAHRSVRELYFSVWDVSLMVNTHIYALTRSFKWRVTLQLLWFHRYAPGMNVRESRGRIHLSHSLSLPGAKSWQTAKRNLCIWTSHIRTEECWTDLKTSKVCETDLIFWRASAEQQKWQSRGAMLQTDCIISTHGNGKTLRIDNK